MPFTFAHPAAVLPLRRTRLVFSALVVGSMAPDFEYFFGMARPVSHSMPGIVTFTFPLALAVLVTFHALVKWPLIALLPRGVQARVIGPARRFHWWQPSRIPWIVVSLAIGIATHLLWDGFTHADGWAVQHWAALRATIPLFARRSFHLYGLLQFASTAAGCIILAWCVKRWYASAPREREMRGQFSPATSWAILGVMIAVAVTAGFVRGSSGWELLLQGFSRRLQFLIGFVITTITVGAIELFGFSLIWQAFLARNMQEERVPASHKR